MKIDKKLYIYNTISRTKEEFIPIDARNVRMYVCGPTLYSAPHLGNARPLIIFDTLFKILKEMYQNVVYVRNITDVDDKIINKAIEEKITFKDVVNNNLVIYKNNLKALNIENPTFEPFATDYIKDMQNLIVKLIDKGIAYSSEGNVFFDINKFSEYGGLSKRNKDELQISYDVITDNMKKNKADFVLWKASKLDEPYWSSHWGNGRPGWHIECSAMSASLLGETFDIHGGGGDLIFPHHENEIAQSRCSFDTKFLAKYWIHNAFINFNSEKMSKSLGNVVTIDDILKSYHGEVLRLSILMTNYNHPLNFIEQILKQSKNILDKMYLSLSRTLDIKISNEELANASHSITFLDAVLDNLNTHLAISELQKMFNNLNKAVSTSDKYKYKVKILKAGRMLGILQDESYLKKDNNNLAYIQDLIKEREQAKNNSNYKKADEIRKKLLDSGIIIEDTKNGTIWRKK